MSPTLNRREFVASAAAGIAAARPAPLFGRAPAVQAPGTVPPVVVASANGHRYTNGGTETCVETAFRRMTSGEDVLDALIAGVNIVELDPEDASVGYGGRPNADGVVQLDACCMHGPKRRAGGVAALEGVRTPSSVARAVADLTDHHLLVGPGARRFARQLGFTVEDDLNTDRSRRLWLEWKRRTDPGHYLDPDRPPGAETAGGPDAAARGQDAGLDLVAEGVLTEEELYGTINCDGINAAGEICGVTTTSGLAWKIPGRVGDSPIVGAGLYVDNDVGACGSTGRGEAVIKTCGSHSVVELMRSGMSPVDACLEALRRVVTFTAEARLRDGQGRPNYNVNYYAVNKDGEYGGAAIWSGARFAVCTGGESRREDSAYLFERGS